MTRAWLLSLRPPARLPRQFQKVRAWWTFGPDRFNVPGLPQQTLAARATAFVVVALRVASVGGAGFRVGLNKGSVKVVIPNYFNSARAGVMNDLTREDVMAIIQRFLLNQPAATAIEYGLISGLIALVIITGVSAVGTKLSTKFVTLAGSLK
jgi:pilus assembly protein Flp/PilA